MNPELARQVAANASADSDLLQKLSVHSDAIVRQAVASNPNTPTAALLKLGAEFPAELLDNPVFFLLILENLNLVNEIPIATLRSLLRQPNVPFFLIEFAANQTDREVQLALAMNPQTPQDVLERLTQSRFPDVAEAARLHVNVAGEWVGDTLSEAFNLLRPSLDRIGTPEKDRFAVLIQLGLIPELLLSYGLTSPNYFELRVTLAAASATAPTLVEKLACSPAAEIRKAVLQNPSVSVEILQALARDSEALIRLKVIQHPKTPPHVIKQLTTDSDRNLAERAKQRIESQQQVSNVLVALEDPSITREVRKALVALPYNVPLSSEARLKLSKHPQQRVREFIAKHPQTPGELLNEFALDEAFAVRGAVVTNPNTPLKTLLKVLARSADTCHGVAYLLSGVGYDTPEKELLLDLLAETSTCDLEAIAQRLIQTDILKVQQFLAKRCDLPIAAIAQLAQINDPEIQQAIAQNPNTPSYILENLAKSGSDAVRVQVAINLNTPSSVVDRLANDAFTPTRRGAMKNPNLSPEAAVEILCGKYAAEFVSFSSYCRSLPPEYAAQVFDNYAQSDPCRFVRWIALVQPQVSPEILKQKSLSIDWLDRFAVAQNPAVPSEVRRSLAQDSNRLVRAIAQRI